MKLLIITTYKDLSCHRIIEEAELKGIETVKLEYHDADPDSLKSDFCILRHPRGFEEEFPGFMKKMVSVLRSNQLLDYSTFKNHPEYEDKIYQHKLYGKIAKMPRHWSFSSVEEARLDFPVIAKKRFSGKCRHVFILDSEEEMKKLFAGEDITEYIFEEYLKFEKDVRVVVLNRQVIGAVERSINVKKKRNGFMGIGVRVKERYKMSEEMEELAVKIAETSGADFCGIDFAVMNGVFYLIECNLMPEFATSEPAIETNVAEKLVDFILEKITQI